MYSYSFQMIDNNVSGVGIVDSNGRLVNTISIRDLRGLQMDSGVE